MIGTILLTVLASLAGLLLGAGSLVLHLLPREDRGAWPPTGPMKVGTKSVLFGAHCFLIHPWFVAWAWWKLYGFPWDPRLWVAFFIHDFGYWGSPNMDGPEGERHPEWAARVMTRLFDGEPRFSTAVAGGQEFGWRCCFEHVDFLLGPWGQLVLFHSRFYAKRNGARPSRLCIADKLAICLTPWWLYRITAGLTGEIQEYRGGAAARSEGEHESPDLSDRAWYVGMQMYMRRWVQEHRDGKADTWTPDAREARDDTGVKSCSPEKTTHHTGGNT